MFAEAEAEQNKLIAEKNEEGKDIIINMFDGSTIEINKQNKNDDENKNSSKDKKDSDKE